MNIPILATKLFIPKSRKELVVRNRLYKKLDVDPEKKLILVSAPAGFGKSTLVSNWAVTKRKRAAWLTLDKEDNQAARFLNYLITALQKLDRLLGKQAVQMLAANRLASSNAVLTSLINDLQKIHGEIYLILDDFHLINDQEIFEALTFILDHCPDNFHLLIISRSDPLLPISRLRARDQIVEIRAADLRFTDQEAAQFLNDVMALQLETRMIAALEKRTEGWIAGLQMAALSMSSRDDILEFVADFSGTNRYIMDYLLEEVLKHLPAEVQQFLLYTSILRRLRADLCDAIVVAAEEAMKDNGVQTASGGHLPVGQAKTILEYLDAGNIFLNTLDEDRTWYRYHDLFADMLRNRLQEKHSGIISVLNKKASDWLEQNGFISEAIHHLMTAGESDHAAELIERYGPEYLAENDPSILQMADQLPGGIVLKKPKIGLYLVWLLIVQGHINKTRPLINDLEKQLISSDQDQDSDRRWMKTFLGLANAFLTGSFRVQRGDHLADFGLLDEIPEEEKILRNAADYLFTMTLARQNDLEGAASIALESLRRENQTRETEAIPTLAPFLSRIYLIQGYLTKCAALCQEYLSPVKRADHQFIYASGNMKIDLGEVCSERNELEEAERLIRKGLQSNELWQNIMTDCFGLAALTRVLIARKKIPEAMRTVEKFEARLQDPSRPQDFEDDLLTLKLRVRLADGDLKYAASWADQVRHRVDFEQQKDLYCLTLARVNLAQGRYVDIENLLTNANLPPAIGSQVSRELERKLLLASAAVGQEQMDKALGLLESCLALAEPDGYKRVFMDIGESIHKLLKMYIKSSSSVHSRYAQMLLRIFDPSKPAIPGIANQDGLIEPLSGRELEVLRLMADGRTNKEIAVQLIISAGTVKAHTSNIYRKLNVENRTEAAAKARQIGLLS